MKLPKSRLQRLQNCRCCPRSVLPIVGLPLPAVTVGRRLWLAVYRRVAPVRMCWWQRYPHFEALGPRVCCVFVGDPLYRHKAIAPPLWA
jgi:hypothetical protein